MPWNVMLETPPWIASHVRLSVAGDVAAGAESDASASVPPWISKLTAPAPKRRLRFESSSVSSTAPLRSSVLETCTPTSERVSLKWALPVTNPLARLRLVRSPSTRSGSPLASVTAPTPVAEYAPVSSVSTTDQLSGEASSVVGPVPNGLNVPEARFTWMVRPLTVADAIVPRVNDPLRPDAWIPTHWRVSVAGPADRKSTRL